MLKRKLKYFFLDHKYFRLGATHAYLLFMCAISSLFFTLGFKLFMSLDSSAFLNNPSVAGDTNIIYSFATGGMSGLAQCIIMLLEIIIYPTKVDQYLFQSIFYFCLNIPLLIFSFIKLGWKFSLYTALNVILVSVFTSVIPIEGLLTQISTFIIDENITRAIFGGICTGIASSFAFIGHHSTGGVDIISYFISLKKSTNTGKYIIGLNVIIILLFSILSVSSGNSPDVARIIISACFSCVYLFVSSLVIDSINVQNKKVLLQVITSNQHLSRTIIANVPHSCTILKAKGGFTGADKIMIYVVVSSREAVKLATEIRKIDQTSFINSIDIRQVYGKFFIQRNR